ncbi:MULTISPECIES: 23S rRNA pseudouridine(1911/1915/1917) synthase RluD [unclassified Colwellia]|jgi:23S rRNA pseudouridine1911/1915/1917 synthase|uniref:23S rRNA pseudouridine(1911/1915/1917) synthase RluD n=1 Tax=unclassified Colwellia TaxID=196834 RepID=UPI0015F740FA|nr:MULTISPECIES: 23S rRNA pseudouridine(1911/1915/1917) synthase RluD [unclassified Colwellia]MBA6362187.1 23S rRNA pseudouridine(1911/1915/1917) synthase RluD [Colwellia sp. BRX8-8]MBA6335583.1 23S rRNA pseudouridine(1911/1915/1917) synthase RluD [Colwellia sp. BRX8-7]MBA6350002.1 23S rRNA pseudouridine(1911/1915/1917) synthase RluD [Colwellia sp. BRX8-9]MBA6353940.1 23S rRNA pseudouridine(1911/1915/1917) synthase RluD [Colwellia sp. BRX9-1]MBA6356915.1 23S rRNA pseudouridine(1911/1915/1917) |tara:strand:+ start:2668 stop:3645 length:978 start_codon:yes stop_codon:yes gene_type:complete
MAEIIQHTDTVPETCLGKRFDQTLAEMFPEYSRSRIKEWILAGHVTLNGAILIIPREKMFGGEVIKISTEVEGDVRFEPQNIPLNIVYEDDDIIVINKPAGFVVHPGAGNPDGTVLNALLYHCPQLDVVPRAGIVHRLDKDTTGLMVIAKTIAAQTNLVDAIQEREITREYEAIANGLMTAGGMVDEPIGRHSTKRTHMAVSPFGRPSVTHYRVMEKFRLHTRLRLRLETGRTHQIRVHMAHITHPLIGDPNYGGRPRPPKNATEDLRDLLRSFKRQALHAAMLSLFHPITGEEMTWHAPIPEDMVNLTNVLREDSKINATDDYL